MAGIQSWQKFLDKCLKSADGADILSFYTQSPADKEDITTVLRKRLLGKEDWIITYLNKQKSSAEDLKNWETAHSLRLEGNSLFKRKQNDKALQKYNQAITHAPHDEKDDRDSELAFGFANRSAVLFHQKRYTCCIDDINHAIKCGYPKRLMYKLHLRKGQCYYHLKKCDESLKVFLESRQYVTDAELGGDKYDTVNHDINEWIKTVANSLGMAQSDNTNISIPKVDHGNSVVLVNASNSLEVQYDEDKGRHVLATRKISSGDTLIVEKPYAAVLLPDHYSTHCHHCISKLSAFVPCSHCTEVKYCSFECATLSWEKYHKWECGLLNLFHAIGIAHLSLRVILISGFNFLLEFKSTHIERNIDENPGNIAGLNKDGVYRCDYLAVYELLPHINKMSPGDVLQYAVTAELLLRCLQLRGFFIEDSCVRDGFQKLTVQDEKSNFEVYYGEKLERNSTEIYIGNLLLRHMCQLVCNAHAVTAVQVSDSIESASTLLSQDQVRIATAIYPTTSLLNHSCDPTIINSFDKDVLVVRAIKDVPAGGEIFNCYGPHFKRMPRFKRQEILREQYFFTCHCPPCEEDETTELKYQSLKCQQCEGPLIFKSPNPDHTCLECGYKTTALTEMKQVLSSQQLFTQGCTLMQTGELKGAINFLEKCQTVRAKVMYKYHRDLAEVNDSLARCYAAVGNFEESVKYLAESTRANKVIYGPDSIEYGHELHKYSEVLCNARKLTEAFQTATKAEEIFSTHYGDSHELVVEIRDYLCKLQMLNSY